MCWWMIMSFNVCLGLLFVLTCFWGMFLYPIPKKINVWTRCSVNTIHNNIFLFLQQYFNSNTLKKMSTATDRFSWTLKLKVCSHWPVHIHPVQSNTSFTIHYVSDTATMLKGCINWLRKYFMFSKFAYRLLMLNFVSCLDVVGELFISIILAIAIDI